MTKSFDILEFKAAHDAALAKIASDFRRFGVTKTCALSTVAIAATGRRFQGALAGVGRPIKNQSAWLLTAARKLLARQFQPAAFVSIDEKNDEGIALVERIAATEPEKNVWQLADDAGMSMECDALEGGTAALAQRLGVTRRRAQQKFAQAAAEARAGRQNDMFCRVAA
jgi:hypothetical protein